MRSWPLALLLAALAVLPICSGCGGDSPPTVAASSLGKPEFVDRVNAICTQGRLRGLRYEPAADGESEAAALPKRIKDNLLPAIQDTIDQIYDLGAPEGDQAQIEQLLVSLQGAVDAGVDLAKPSIKRLENLFAQSGRLARDYGVTSCIYG